MPTARKSPSPTRSTSPLPPAPPAQPTTTTVIASPVLTPSLAIHPGDSTGPIALATFTDVDPESADHYTANINWGNGNISAGEISLSNGVFTVDGFNSYASAGEYSPVISVQKDALSPQSVTDSDLVSVANLTPEISADAGVTLNGLSRHSLSATVATFTSAYTSTSAGDYKAKINWGDGKSTFGKIIANGGGHFSIVASHLYQRNASYAITVSLKDVFKDTVTIDSTASITGASQNAPIGKSQVDSGYRHKSLIFPTGDERRR